MANGALDLSYEDIQNRRMPERARRRETDATQGATYGSLQREPNVPRTGTPRQMPQGERLRPDVAQAGRDFLAGGQAATQQIAEGGRAAAQRLAELYRSFTAPPSGQQLSPEDEARRRALIAQIPTEDGPRSALRFNQPDPRVTGPFQQFNQPDPRVTGPAPGLRVSGTSVPGVSRVDNAPGLRSPLFTNLPVGEAISGLQGGTVSTFDGSALRAAAQRFREEAQQERELAALEGPRGGVIGSGEDQARARREALDRALAAFPGEGRAAVSARARLVESFLEGERGYASLTQEAQLREADRAAALQRLALEQRGATAIGRQRAADELALQQLRGEQALTEAGTRGQFGIAEQALRNVGAREVQELSADRRANEAYTRALAAISRIEDPAQREEAEIRLMEAFRPQGFAGGGLVDGMAKGYAGGGLVTGLEDGMMGYVPSALSGGLVPRLRPSRGYAPSDRNLNYDSYANGGIVRGIGDTPRAAQVLPEVNEYRDYADGARAMGLPTIPFEQFVTLRAGARQVAQAPGPTQPMTAMGFAAGGVVPEAEEMMEHRGGMHSDMMEPNDVSGKMIVDLNPNAPTDSIPAVVDGAMPARLDSGEFVIPKDVVAFFGTKHLDQMIAAARKGRTQE